MTKAIVGRWGKSLAVRVPADVARLAGLADGESVDVEAIEGKVVIRRDEAHEAKRLDAIKAAAEIRAERSHYRLDGISIRELIDEGRR